MKTIEEMIAVMQAYADGKKIERRDFLTPELWQDCYPEWNWGIYDYRVKPEPKYRPYANAEECFKDVIKHRGWVKKKAYDFYRGIYNIGDNGVVFNDYDGLMEYYVWADDGTPCGVKEE